MKRARSALAVLAVTATASAAILTGCTPAEDGGDDAAGTLDVVFWNYGPLAEGQYQGAADAFMAANEGVEVSLTPVAGENWGTYYANVATMIASGERPDLMLISTEGAQFVHANGLVQPINGYLESDPGAQELRADVADGLIEFFTVDGDVIALADAWNDMVIWYNTDVFAAAGVEPPSADWTWDEFVDVAARLSSDTDGDGANDTYGFTWASNEIFPGILPWVANAGGNLVSDDVCAPTVDSPEVIEAVSFLNDLIAEGIAPAPMPMSDVFTRFQNGTIAMFGAGRWPNGSFGAAGFTAGDIQLYPTGATYKTVAGGGAYAILSSSEDPDLAWEFQKFTLSDEIQELYVGTPDAPGDLIPSRRSIAAQMSEQGVPPANSELFYAIIDDYPPLVPFPAPPEYSEFEATVLRNLQLIFAGDVSVEAGLAAMQSELEPIVTCE
ncbi:sugar ABC transporter substrate-binding protein [Microbacterium limosum]|uniref:Sugar ABC transporter substrate-binding protein n=1 Tax=Microbacterium limosum TaxID=3079935 RepID=A0AAU0MK61_9MICO|nr:sugar ABC transporter substrate-binding protein [Microbacterium sp. Y20]WOQ70649.1 sugar ABC transporter substrate-binding protein [Microbacterium sp. Y20]